MPTKPQSYEQARPRSLRQQLTRAVAHLSRSPQSTDAADSKERLRDVLWADRSLAVAQTVANNEAKARAEQADRSLAVAQAVANNEAKARAEQVAVPESGEIELAHAQPEAAPVFDELP